MELVYQFPIFKLKPPMSGEFFVRHVDTLNKHVHHQASLGAQEVSTESPHLLLVILLLMYQVKRLVLETRLEDIAWLGHTLQEEVS